MIPRKSKQKLPLKTQTSPLLPILLVNFIGSLGLSIVLPFLIILVLKFGGNEVIYGLIAATYSAFQLVGAPLLGNWSDRIGRRMVLLVSQAGTFVAWVIFMIALLIPERVIGNIDSHYLGSFLLTIPLLLLFIARAVDGITGGNISVANAYLSDISSDETRNSNFGKMGAAAGLGFIIGPAIAGLLGNTSFGEILPVILAMVISFIAIAVIYFMLPESHNMQSGFARCDHHSNSTGTLYQERQPKHDTGFFRAIKKPHAAFMISLNFLFFLAFNFLYVAFPVHAVQILKWDIFQLGIFFSVLSVVMILVQGPVLSYVSKFISEGKLVVIGSVMLCIGFACFGFQNSAIAYLGGFGFGVGNSLMWPSFLSILSKLGGRHDQGIVQGYAGSARSLASVIGLISGGLLYQQIGSITFFISSVLLIILAALSFRLVAINSKLTAIST